MGFSATRIQKWIKGEEKQLLLYKEAHCGVEDRKDRDASAGKRTGHWTRAGARLGQSHGKLLVPEELPPILVSQTHQTTYLGHDKLEELI